MIGHVCKCSYFLTWVKAEPCGTLALLLRLLAQETPDASWAKVGDAGAAIEMIPHTHAKRLSCTKDRQHIANQSGPASCRIGPDATHPWKMSRRTACRKASATTTTLRSRARAWHRKIKATYHACTHEPRGEPHFARLPPTQKMHGVLAKRHKCTRYRAPTTQPVAGCDGENTRDPTGAWRRQAANISRRLTDLVASNLQAGRASGPCAAWIWFVNHVTPPLGLLRYCARKAYASWNTGRACCVSRVCATRMRRRACAAVSTCTLPSSQSYPARRA